MLAYIRHLYSLYKSNDHQLKSFENIRNKWWVQFSDNEELTKWRFEKDGLLTISIDGDVTNGKWRILDGTSEIVITYQTKKSLFRQNFLQDNVLVLVKDSIRKDWLAFYDENTFSPKEIEAYIETKEEEAEAKRIKNNNIKQLRLFDGRTIEIYRDPSQTIPVKIGNKVKIREDDAIPDGELTTTAHQILTIDNGKIKNIHFMGTYKVNGSFDVTFKQKKYRQLTVGDEIFRAVKSVTEGLHKLNSNIGVSIKHNTLDLLYTVKKSSTFRGRSLDLWFPSSGASMPVYAFYRNKPAKDGIYILTSMKIIKVEDGKVV